MPEMMSEVLQHVTRNPKERIDAIERGVNGDVSILILDNERNSDVGAVPRLQELAVFLPDWYASRPSSHGNSCSSASTSRHPIPRVHS